MAALSIGMDTARAQRATRLLGRVGHWGALLTLAILAASVLLRLSSFIDADGVAHSRLPGAVETVARLAHRVSAMAVSVLALLAAMIAFTTRPVPPGRIAAVVLILAVTVFLAILGRYTPGYRDAMVTLGNVLGGLLLVSAFWWLREHAAAIASGARAHEVALAWIAFAMLLAQAALGATTSALAMHGQRGLDAVHLGTGVAFLVLVAFAAWPHRKRAPTRALALRVALLTATQLAMGLFLAAASFGRPWALAWGHAMVACLLAMALVSLASRSRQVRFP